MKKWARENPQRLGRLLILLGLVIAGFFTHQDDAAEWQDYTVTAIDRVSTLHRGHIEHTYRLQTASSAKIAIEYTDLFNQGLLRRQPLPVPVEILAVHEAKDGMVWAQGLRLKQGGEVLLDSESVRRRHLPKRIFGFSLGGLLLGAGVYLQFKRRPAFTGT